MFKFQALSPEDAPTTEDEFSDARSEWKVESDGDTPLLLTPASATYDFGSADEDNAAVNI